MLKAFDSDYFIALLLLMPGFLSRQVMIYFGNSSDGGEFENISASLAFSLVDFVIAMFFWKGYLIIRRKSRPEEASLEKITPAFISLLLAVCIIVGLSSAWIDRNGIIYRTFSPSTRVSRTRPWITAWDKCRPAWAKVKLSDGRSYFGYMIYYSDDDKNTELVLNRVSILKKDGKPKKIKANRVVLFGKDIVSVEIYPAVGVNGCRDDNDF